MNPDKLQTLAVAAVPPAAGITLAQVNTALGFVSLVLGIAFTVWNWRRLAREKQEAAQLRLPFLDR